MAVDSPFQAVPKPALGSLFHAQRGAPEARECELEGLGACLKRWYCHIRQYSE